jgi:hypothetical protein
MGVDPNVWRSRMFVEHSRRGRFALLMDLFSDLSGEKILRLAFILTISGVCWLGVGCVALELLQLAAH